MFPCPCCGYLIFRYAPGSDEVCPICFWEDDVSQLRFATEGGGANEPSLLEAQQNFLRVGVSDQRLKSYVRPPLATEHREVQWRVIDTERDNVEEPEPGKDYGATYPRDRTTLYYWRSTYWRK